jgi:WD40 repeat protein
MAEPLFAINTGAHCFDAQFHPSRSLLTAATVTGEIELYQFDLEACSASGGGSGSSTAEPTQLLRKLGVHEESCRTARFFGSEQIASSGADQSAVVSDLETGSKIWSAKLSDAGNSLLQLSERKFAVGADDGSICIFDIRQTKPPRQYTENEDFISDMALGTDGFSLCATSGDGTLAVYDIRKKGKGSLIAMSDFQEDELLSLAIVKDGKKVVCGSQGGVMAIFSWGDFGDQKDRVNGHPMSIDAMVKLSEGAVLTGSSDGRIRVVSIHNQKYGNCIVGCVGEHGAFPLENLALSPNGGLIASVSHSQPAVKVWSAERAHKLLEDLEKNGEGAEQAAAPAEEVEPDSDDSDEPVSNKKMKKGKRKKGMAKRQAAKASKSATSFFGDM